jgi:uncharacterized membrane protein YjjB (DUF3815 family)
MPDEQFRARVRAAWPNSKVKLVKLLDAIIPLIPGLSSYRSIIVGYIISRMSEQDAERVIRALRDALG